jgi:hypothetical protein
MIRKASIIALTIMVLFVPLSLFAQPIGKVTYLEGNMDIQAPGKEAKDARSGDPVSAGDIVRAKSNSKAEITFQDGNILRLAQNTRVRISNYELGGQKDGYFDLSRGKIQCLINKLNKGVKFEARTPTAVIGVRGTDFFAYHQNGISGAVFKVGAGYMFNRNMPKDIMTIRAGQAALITASHLPPVMKPATSIEIEKHLNDTTPTKEKLKKEGELPKGTSGGQGTAPAAETVASGTVASGAVSAVQDATLQQQQTQTQQELQLQGQQQTIQTQGVTQIQQQAAQTVTVQTSTIQPTTPTLTYVNLSPLSGGALYSIAAAALKEVEYQNPHHTNNSSFEPRAVSYASHYFQIGAGTALSAGETIKRVANAGTANEQHYRIDYLYEMTDTFFGVQSYDRNARGEVTRVIDRGATSSLAPVPDFSGALPVTPHFDTTKINANANPGVTVINSDQYVKTFEDSFATNTLVKGLAIQGILQGQDSLSLWSTTSASPMSIRFDQGTIGAYTGGQIFGAATENANLNGGAYFSQTGGIVQVSGAAADAVAGLVIGLYINGAEAGLIRGAYSGSTSAGVWNSTGSIYRDVRRSSGGSGTLPAPVELTSLAATPYSGLFRGKVGLTYDTIMKGTFTGSPTGSITNLFLTAGNSYSIIGQPDWGYLNLYSGAGNTYSNPDGKAAWTGRISGMGEFGLYAAAPANYADMGFWYADIIGGAWSGNRMSGGLLGEFLTFKKWGTLEGSLLGTYTANVADPTSGTWQSIAVGGWQKGATGGDVFFGSEIRGSTYELKHNKSGSKSYPSASYYNFDYNDTGPRRWGYSYYYNSALNRTVYTFYDQYGPSGDRPVKQVWTNDGYAGPGNPGTFTEQTSYFNNPDGTPNYTAYYNDMASLETDPENPALTVASNPGWSLNYSSFGGVMAGLDNLWANLDSTKATPLKFMGKVETARFTNVNSSLFGGTVVSFDPLLTVNPMSDSRTPTMGGKYGAYYGFIGGSVDDGASRSLSGLLRGLYMDQNNLVGILYGSFTGNHDDATGLWKADGNAWTYALNVGPLTSGATAVTPQNFASLLSTKEEQYYASSEPGLPAVGATIYLGNARAETAGIENMTPLTTLGVFKNISGGTYTGTPGAWSWSWTVDRTGQMSNPNRMDYINVKISDPVNNAFSGSMVQTQWNWQDARNAVIGGEIRGTFKPDNLTWKAATLGVGLSTDHFITRMDAMTTDAQRTAFEQATRIPSFEVGQANLSGNDGNLFVNMNNMRFYRYSTETNPRLWATKDVSGSYTSNPAVGTTVSLTSAQIPGLTTSFQVKNWDTTGKIWGAQIYNPGASTGILTRSVTDQLRVPIGTPTAITINEIKGGAAGMIDTTNKTFQGGGSGIVR